MNGLQRLKRLTEEYEGMAVMVVLHPPIGVSFDELENEIGDEIRDAGKRYGGEQGKGLRTWYFKDGKDAYGFQKDLAKEFPRVIARWEPIRFMFLKQS